MKGRFLVIVILLATGFSCHALEDLTWKSVARVDVVEITERAKSYLAKEAPELNDVKIKLLEVSAGYREGRKRLYVSFYHDKSYREGSEEIIKAQTADGEIEHSFITFDIVVVRFDDSGQPKSKEIFGQKYAGTKEDFKRQFND